jgi:hypothetical protein
MAEMKIACLTIRNFLGVSEAKIAPKGKVTVLAGDNKQGKSSVLKAIPACFQGMKPAMILTEKEAGKNICCGPPINFHEFHDVPFCVGSGCMAWRWAEEEPSPLTGDIRRGYCGLAGEPEVTG